MSEKIKAPYLPIILQFEVEDENKKFCTVFADNSVKVQHEDSKIVLTAYLSGSEAVGFLKEHKADEILGARPATASDHINTSRQRLLQILNKE